MTDALSLKENANNVYKNNVNKRGTLEESGSAERGEGGVKKKKDTSHAAKRPLLSKDR